MTSPVSCNRTGVRLSRGRMNGIRYGSPFWRTRMKSKNGYGGSGTIRLRGAILTNCLLYAPGDTPKPILRMNSGVCSSLAEHYQLESVRGRKNSWTYHVMPLDRLHMSLDSPCSCPTRCNW